MTAYVVYSADVIDQDRYEEYKQRAEASVVAAGGRYIVRGGDIEVLEGEPPAGRTVILEFPSRDAATAWYRSDEYAVARKVRASAATARLYVIDGVG